MFTASARKCSYAPESVATTWLSDKGTPTEAQRLSSCSGPSHCVAENVVTGGVVTVGAVVVVVAAGPTFVILDIIG